MKKTKLWNRFSDKFDLLVKKFEDRFLHYNSRRLHVETSGRLYILFTIILGVVAILANNNLLFLLESFLLGGLILSGVLSEYAVSSIDMKWVRKPCFSDAPTHDLLLVKNRGKLPLLCIDLGEWRQGEFVSFAFIPILGSGETAEVTSQQILSKRGTHTFEGWGVETRYPFGFTKKLRWHEFPGSRIVWAARIKGIKRTASRLSNGRNEISELKDGEVESANFQREYKKLVFAKTLQTGALFARIQDPLSTKEQWNLNISGFTKETLEVRISELTSEIYKSGGRLMPVLSVKAFDKTYRYEGLSPCLNALAQLEPAE